MLQISFFLHIFIYWSHINWLVNFNIFNIFVVLTVLFSLFSIIYVIFAVRYHLIAPLQFNLSLFWMVVYIYIYIYIYIYCGYCTLHKPCKQCHVPHASRITAWVTIFTKIFFGVFKEWVRSWSHPFLITNLKTSA